MTVLNFKSKAFSYQDLCRDGGTICPSRAWSNKDTLGQTGLIKMPTPISRKDLSEQGVVASLIDRQWKNTVSQKKNFPFYMKLCTYTILTIWNKFW